MRNLISVLFAPILLAALSLASPQERTVGAPDSPIVAYDEAPISPLIAQDVDSFVCVRSRVQPGRVIVRQIVGVPGTTLTADRGDILVVASTGSWGTEDAATPPTVITTTWVSGGATIVVTVTQGPNEPIPDFTRRVDATVRAMQNLRPRDGPSTDHDWNH